MSLNTVASFKVEYLQIMDEHGKVDKKLMPNVQDAEVLRWYRAMVLSRKFSDKMLSLQRQGRLGTFAPINGQEAAQVGSCSALQPSDWMFPSFREIAAYVYRGENIVPMLLYNMGSEEGNKGDSKFNNAPPSIPVGSQYAHAVGRAWASKIKGEKTVSLVYGGDGSTSQGDFHEACNFAGVFQVPCVIVVQNNQWAISVPRSQQTHAQTLAQKAIAYGFEGIQVDGNDIFAMYKATKDAVDKARKGKGPTLIEAMTYRLSMHTTADDPKVYRSDSEVKQWEKKDPILRLHKFLESKKLWNEKKEKILNDDIDKQLSEAVKEAEQRLNKDPGEMFKYMFAVMPKHLEEEMKEVEGRGE